MAIVEFQLLREGSKIPSRGSVLSGGLDVYAPEGGSLYSGEVKTIPLGIGHQINDKLYPGEFHIQGFMISRSSLARDFNVKLFFDPCLIDHDYRGEIMGVFQNMGSNRFDWLKHDRLCQLVYVPVWAGQPGLVERLRPSNRGIGGFGSTGR